jgi:hypothetical protein
MESWIRDAFIASVEMALGLGAKASRTEVTAFIVLFFRTILTVGIVKLTSKSAAGPDELSVFIRSLPTSFPPVSITD